MPQRRQVDKAHIAKLLSYDSVKNWLTQETIRSEATRVHYIYNLKLLVDRTGLNPDELVTQRIEDMTQRDFAARQRMERTVREFKAELEKESKCRAFIMVAAACSFFKANTGARLNINNPSPEPEHECFIYNGDPSHEQDFWQKVVDHAPSIRDAALFMIGLEAGPRDGSVLKMTVGDVTAEFAAGKPPYQIRIPPPGQSPTRKRGGISFICEDTKKKIEAYLSLRGSRGFSVQAPDQLVVDLDTGRPLEHTSRLNETLQQAFLDAGALSHDQIYPPDVRLSPVRWYCLRKRAQTIMEDNTDGTGIALNWVDELLSHRKRGAQAGHYSKPTVQQLRGAYGKAMHRLMVYRETRPQMTDDEFMRRFNKAWALLGDDMARKMERMEHQTVTGPQIARILRELMTVSKEAE